ncbi:MAG: hypothetical protein WCI11_17835 [Candidatus Methylumidiphilus sp.]
MLGQEAEIVLFGSQVDESARGGDVDLLITLLRWGDRLLSAASAEDVLRD